MKRQLKSDFQRLKNTMSRIVRLHGGRCADDTKRGLGIHTTYELGNVRVGFTWHLSPSDSRYAIKKCIAQLRRILTALGLVEHRDELFCLMSNFELYELEQDLFDQIARLEQQCSSLDRAA
jgi:hypothetical protein